MKFLIVVSELASHDARSSSGESIESPIGQTDSIPLRGSRIMPYVSQVTFRGVKVMYRMKRTREEGGGSGRGNARSYDDSREPHDSTVDITSAGKLIYKEL
jgi:hypothetical protein